jgi:transcriptional regulator of arginine metabolism
MPPTDNENRERRRQAILEILRGGPPVSSQKEIVDLLKTQGIEATQSSISRDLQDLGAVRFEGRYEINTWTDVEEDELKRVFHFVHRATPAGANLTILATDPGAARIVALAIQKAHWPEVVGIVSDDATIFIATDDQLSQKLVFLHIKALLEEQD